MTAPPSNPPSLPPSSMPQVTPRRSLWRRIIAPLSRIKLPWLRKRSAPTPAPAVSEIDLAPEPKTPTTRPATKTAPRPAVWSPAPPPWPLISEPPKSRWLAIVVLLVITTLYSLAIFQYAGYAHPGVDQSGYLGMARLIYGERNIEFPTSAPLTPPLVTEASAPDSPPVAAPTPAPSINWMGPAKPLGVWIRNRLGFTPESPFQFGSRMSIMTEPFRDPKPGEEPYRIYAKYPFGYPLLAAAARALTGSWDGMYLVNPVCTVLACFFAYFLFRTAVTRFAAIMGVVFLATNPVVLNYANDANSHASTLFCVVFGFWGLLSWWQTGAKWRGFLGALALGYACTIRYSEFLLVLPVTFAAVANLRTQWRPRGRRLTGLRARLLIPAILLLLAGIVAGVVAIPALHSAVRPLQALGVGVLLAAVVSIPLNLRFETARLTGSITVLLGWAIPVAVLAFVCWVCFGAPWKNGYSYCKEDGGFGWKYFIGENLEMTNRNKEGNWETLIQQFNHIGLFMLWSLAAVGMLGMLGKSWRLGTALVLWVVPTTALYLFYYWAPQGEANMGYLRFFASAVPGFVFAAIWVVDRALAYLPGEKWPSLVYITLLGLIAASWGGYYFWPKEFDWAHWTTRSTLVAYGPSVGGGVFVLATLSLIWVFEREQAARRVGLALAMAGIGALCAGTNTSLMVGTLERQHQSQLALHDTVANIRLNLPRGSVLFADENMCQQLDCTGGYQLFSQQLLQPSAFNFHKMALQRAVGNGAEDLDNPNPVQRERSLYYMNLLGAREGNSLIPKTLREKQAPVIALIKKAIARGQHVGWLTSYSDRAGGAGNTPAPGDVLLLKTAGLKVRTIAHWDPQPPVTTDPLGLRWQGWRGALNPTGPAGPGGPARPVRGPRDTSTTHWVLYEIELEAPAATKPATKPAAATRPVTRPASASPTASAPAPATAPAPAATRPLPVAPATQGNPDLFKNVPAEK